MQLREDGECGVAQLRVVERDVLELRGSAPLARGRTLAIRRTLRAVSAGAAMNTTITEI